MTRFDTSYINIFSPQKQNIQAQDRTQRQRTTPQGQMTETLRQKEIRKHRLVKTSLCFIRAGCLLHIRQKKRLSETLCEKNCIPSKDDDNIRLTIYYKSPRVSNLIMCNNLSNDNAPLKSTNVVYEYKCQIGDCARRRNSSYIGHTTTSLSRRLTMHLQGGGPMTHTLSDHGRKLQRSDLVDNTKILTKCSQSRKLKVLEAVYIRDKDPSINRQQNMRGTLWLYDGQPLEARS